MDRPRTADATPRGRPGYAGAAGPARAQVWSGGLGRCALAPAAALALTACVETEPATIVAIPGCGLDGEVLTELRVRTRGDFPASAGTQVLVSAGVATVGEDLGDIAAITVEGLFFESVSGIGRTARMRATGEIPVYFGAVDRLCEVPADGVVAFRHPGAVAVGPSGDVLIVGGRDVGGTLFDEIIHFNDERQGVQRAVARLPEPATGQSIHAVGPRDFVVVGGAGAQGVALTSIVSLHVAEDGAVFVDTPTPIVVPMQTERGRAWHGAAQLSPGVLLVTGGCTAVESDGRCSHAPDSVLSSSILVTLSDAEPKFRRGPPLLSARYRHSIHVARDGVAFAVGGWGASGKPVLALDMFRVDGPGWEPYGPDLTAQLPDDAEILGSTILEGGLVVLAIDDGTLRWVNPEATGIMPGWCDPQLPDGPCFEAASMGALPSWLPRPLLTLPGERIVADHFVAPVAAVGGAGDRVIDLSVAANGTQLAAPPQRRGGLPVGLADGSVLLVGGLNPRSAAPLSPLVLRLRPALDGPDERIPGINTLEPTSLIALHPDRVELLEPEGVVRLFSAGTPTDFPVVRARVRGFRSQSFRFELTVSVTGMARVHIVLEQGALAGLSVRLGPDVVRGIFRDGSGSVVDVSCGRLPENFWDQPQSVAVAVHSDALVVSQGEQTLARCPVPPLDVPAAIGLGVSGSGSVEASGLRLTRI